jgi:hypothetical protein
VITSIQPLTKEEADSVLGTTESEYFKTTFRKTLAATNLTMVDDMVVKTAEPGKEFKWPQAPPGQKKKNKSEWLGRLQRHDCLGFVGFDWWEGWSVVEGRGWMSGHSAVEG